MTIVIAMLLVNGVLGAVDTLWYHEWVGRLAERTDTTRTELSLHASRDAVYTVVYAVFAWTQPRGWFAVGIGALLVLELVITLVDFVVEDRTRPEIGGMRAGERVLHTLMAMVYGAMMWRLIPLLWEAADRTTALVAVDLPMVIPLTMTAFAVGIAATGVRDALAVVGIGRSWSLRQLVRPPAKVDQGDGGSPSGAPAVTT